MMGPLELFFLEAVLKHRARKRFGQNFLQDPHIIQSIVKAIAPRENDTVIEIGPGMGAMTLPLAEHLAQIFAIEIDRDLQAFLRAQVRLIDKLTLIESDALRVDFSQWGKEIRVVGNLPYNISTPLILHLLHYCDVISDMHFMLQKELVERMAAQPGCKAFGRLSVICQYYCSVEHLFDVPPESFDPAPKVHSAIVRLMPHQEAPFEKVPHKALEAITAKGFSMRRKTLANNLKGVISADHLCAMGIDPKLRPEAIGIDDWVALAQAAQLS